MAASTAALRAAMNTLPPRPYLHDSRSHSNARGRVALFGQAAMLESTGALRAANKAAMSTLTV